MLITPVFYWNIGLTDNKPVPVTILERVLWSYEELESTLTLDKIGLVVVRICILEGFSCCRTDLEESTTHECAVREVVCPEKMVTKVSIIIALIWNTIFSRKRKSKCSTISECHKLGDDEVFLCYDGPNIVTTSSVESTIARLFLAVLQKSIFVVREIRSVSRDITDARLANIQSTVARILFDVFLHILQTALFLIGVSGKAIVRKVYC